MSSKSQNLKVTNVIYPVIKAEIGTILDSYSYYPYQQAFKDKTLQLKLLAYVLTRVPGLYVVIDASFNLDCYPICSQRMLDIETIIHRGIQDLMPKGKTQPSLRDCYRQQQFIKVV